MASPLNRPGLRAAAASAALTLVALSANVPAAQAIPPPSVDPAWCLQTRGLDLISPCAAPTAAPHRSP